MRAIDVQLSWRQGCRDLLILLIGRKNPSLSPWLGWVGLYSGYKAMLPVPVWVAGLSYRSRLPTTVGVSLSWSRRIVRNKLEIRMPVDDNTAPLSVLRFSRDLEQPAAICAEKKIAF